MSSNRVEWVDVCKGLAILAIFIGHIGPGDITTIFVFRYHVPLFFFLSGFFFTKRRELGIKDYIYKCIKGTLIPYIFFCIFNIVFEIVINGGSLDSLRLFLKQGFFGVRDQIDFAVQLWFLTCLFSIQIIYYFLNKVIKNSIARIVITFIITLISAIYLKMPSNTRMFFNIDSALYYTFFYCLGEIIYPKIENFSFSKLNFNHKIIISIFNVLILAGTFYIYSKYGKVDIATSKLSNISPISVINTSIFQIITLLITCILIAANVIVSFGLSHSNYLANIGRNTIILCGCERIAMVLVFQVFGFLGIQLKTNLVIYKIFITFLKVAVIQKLFFPIFINNLYWAIGHVRNKKVF